MLAGLLPVRERILGPEHPDTLITLSNLARWTGESGEAAAARDLLTGLLPMRERILGPEHPDVDGIANSSGDRPSMPDAVRIGAGSLCL